MHYGSILLNFATRSPSRADATENGVLRDANEPDRSGIPALGGYFSTARELGGIRSVT
jgi:hypothetical protein